METDEKQKIEKLRNVKLDNEIESQELSLEEKRFLVEEMKKRHGPNWRQAVGFTGKLTKAAFDSLLNFAKTPTAGNIRQRTRLL